MLLGLPCAEAGVKQLVLSGRLVDHVRHPGVPSDGLDKLARIDRVECALETYQPGSICDLYTMCQQLTHCCIVAPALTARIRAKKWRSRPISYGLFSRLSVCLLIYAYCFTYAAAPPQGSRRTCCRICRCRSRYRAWCRLWKLSLRPCSPMLLPSHTDVLHCEFQC